MASLSIFTISIPCLLLWKFGLIIEGRVPPTPTTLRKQFIAFLFAGYTWFTSPSGGIMGVHIGTGNTLEI
jgi:hypothetical protein